MTLPDPRDSSQPKPLRVIAAIGGVVTLVVGGLPVFDVPLTPTQTGVLVGVVGALSTLAVVLFGERRVTPVSSPRDNAGRPLVPAGPSGVLGADNLG